MPRVCACVCVCVCVCACVCVYCSDVSITDKIRTNGQDNDVLGLTSVDDELFVLLHQDVYQVTVYSTSDYKRLRYFNLRGFKQHHFNDIVSCVRLKCLFMSDFDSECVLRYDLISRDTSKWDVHRPRSLSVTPSGNLLVTSWGRYFWPNKLLELSAVSGECLRKITLRSGPAEYPAHGVQLPTGQFVVCFASSGLYQVRVVDAEGQLTHTYGGKPYNPDRKHCPYHLAVDSDSQAIFVSADNGVDVLFSPSLSYVHGFRERLSHPCRLYFEQVSRRLFVGQRDIDIAVIQL